MHDMHLDLNHCRAQRDKPEPDKNAWTSSTFAHITEDYVKRFTPFKYKTCLIGFYVTLLLPRLKKMWGFQGYKDQHDKMRREHDDEIHDATRDCQHSTAIEQERQWVQNRIARSAQRSALLTRNKSVSQACAYGDLCGNQQEQQLQPCEHPGCKQFVHRSCSERFCTEQNVIYCRAHANITDKRQKRPHDKTPPPAITGRSVSKILRTCDADKVRRTLFCRPVDTTTTEDEIGENNINKPTDKTCSFGILYKYRGSDWIMHACGVSVGCKNIVHRACSLEVGH